MKINNHNEKDNIQIDILINKELYDYNTFEASIFKGIRKFSIIEKIINEKEIKKLSERLIKNMEPYKDRNLELLSSNEKDNLKDMITTYILELDERKLFFDRPFLKFFIEKGYLNVANDFIARAAREDGQLKPEEVFQAMRNVWIMNSLQIFWGIPLEMTPSIYAYSMLYPYTDNFLDNPDCKTIEKEIFNERLSRVIKGEKIKTDDSNENRVFSFIEQIESQYNRNDYPQVFHSLELIQNAQVESLNQDQEAKMTVDDILPISFFKGGTSVLADAFLVKGALTLNEMQFAFGYGAFLQLLDDLQDISSDKYIGHQTVFSIKGENDNIDNEIRKLISYIFKVNTPKTDDTEAMILMKDVIGSCTLMMVLETVGKHPNLVSDEFYTELESYSIVRLKFYTQFEIQFKALLKNIPKLSDLGI